MNPLMPLVLLFQLETGSPGIAFEPQVVDASLPGAYQVAIVDIDNDDLLDIAALGDGKDSGVFWYKNPTWVRCPIGGPEITNPIDLAFKDVNQDGKVEVALAYEFGMDRTSSGGAIALLEPQEDLSKPWKIKKVDSEPTAHRLRWLNFGILQTLAVPEIIVAPIMGRDTEAPDFDQAGVRLLCFTVPPTGEPEKIILDEFLHIMHGLFVRQNPPEIYTASVEGIVRFTKKDRFNPFDLNKQVICTGAPASEGRTGCSEVAIGAIQGQEYLATIEPWHGNQVVIYPAFPTISKPEDQKRTVIDNTFINGHALACADFDRDGDDEIIAGYRGEGHSIYLYDYDKTIDKWNRQPIDRDVAAQGFFVADVNEDGWLDFVAGGGSTHNVKLYITKSSK